MELYGYIRNNGEAGSRNYVAVIPSVLCVNEIVQNIVNITKNSSAILHHKGCGLLSPDIERTTESLIKIGQNPNVGAVVIISLGCEGVDVNRLTQEIASSGKPVESVIVQKIGGTSKAIKKGVDLVQKLGSKISEQNKEKIPFSKVTMGIKCGASDATSAVASNPVLGYVADKIVDKGGKVIFGETTEFMGAEHILTKRAKNSEVKERIYEIVNKMENRVKSFGVDMRGSQPTPGNIKGGLTTIEEKSLGAIVKSGTKKIEGVLEYTEKPPKSGLWIKDTPGREPEVLTAMSVGGAQIVLFSTGRGAPQGFPIIPVIKVCGNPVTYNKLSNDMDINAGKIITGNKSIEEVGEETFKEFVKVFSGKTTKGEEIKYSTTMDIHTLGPII